jgi:hypothetical protein
MSEETTRTGPTAVVEGKVIQRSAARRVCQGHPGAIADASEFLDRCGLWSDGEVSVLMQCAYYGNGCESLFSQPGADLLDKRDSCPEKGGNLLRCM